MRRPIGFVATLAAVIAAALAVLAAPWWLVVVMLAIGGLVFMRWDSTQMRKHRQDQLANQHERQLAIQRHPTSAWHDRRHQAH